MKFNFVLLLILFLCFSVLAQEWQEYTISDGEFFIKLPAEPQEKNQQIPSDYGVLTMRMLNLLDGNTNYTVTFTDYPGTALLDTNIDTLLDNARDGALKNTEGKLISEKSIKYEEYPGKEIKFSIMNEQAIIKAQYYFVNNRLYQVLVVTDPLKLYTDPIEKYFASFRLTENAGLSQMDRMLQQIGYVYEKNKEGQYYITLEFEDKRTQLVRIGPFISNLTSMETFDIWSIISNDSLAIADSIYESMLVKNGNADIGRFQLFPQNNKKLLVYSAVYNGSWNQDLLKKIINDVGAMADIYEQKITQADEY